MKFIKTMNLAAIMTLLLVLSMFLGGSAKAAVNLHQRFMLPHNTSQFIYNDIPYPRDTATDVEGNIYVIAGRGDLIFTNSTLAGTYSPNGETSAREMDNF